MHRKDIAQKTKLSYDKESDVLYINFEEPQAADDSDVTDEGIIIRLRANKIVGLTILNAGRVLA
ncbi:conserved hypothetical protein [sediment metagenome]|uniref:DUF2283 domain-containing protein n=1 Tax=sediment metagenome TaxID=749907 RepID=D9PIF1_9ZZZZ